MSSFDLGRYRTIRKRAISSTPDRPTITLSPKYCALNSMAFDLIDEDVDGFVYYYNADRRAVFIKFETELEPWMYKTPKNTVNIHVPYDIRDSFGVSTDTNVTRRFVVSKMDDPRGLFFSEDDEVKLN